MIEPCTTPRQFAWQTALTRCTAACALLCMLLGSADMAKGATTAVNNLGAITGPGEYTWHVDTSESTIARQFLLGFEQGNTTVNIGSIRDSTGINTFEFWGLSAPRNTGNGNVTLLYNGNSRFSSPNPRLQLNGGYGGTGIYTHKGGSVTLHVTNNATLDLDTLVVNPSGPPDRPDLALPASKGGAGADGGDVLIRIDSGSTLNLNPTNSVSVINAGDGSPVGTGKGGDLSIVVSGTLHINNTATLQNGLNISSGTDGAATRGGNATMLVDGGSITAAGPSASAFNLLTRGGDSTLTVLNGGQIKVSSLFAGTPANTTSKGNAIVNVLTGSESTPGLDISGMLSVGGILNVGDAAGATPGYVKTKEAYFPGTVTVHRGSTLHSDGNPASVLGLMTVLGEYKARTSRSGPSAVIVNNDGTLVIDGTYGGKVTLDTTYAVAVDKGGTLVMKNGGLLQGMVLIKNMGGASGILSVQDFTNNVITGRLHVGFDPDSAVTANIGAANSAKLTVGWLGVRGGTLNLGNAAGSFASELRSSGLFEIDTMEGTEFGGDAQRLSVMNVHQGSTLFSGGVTRVRENGLLNVYGTYDGTGHNLTIQSRATPSGVVHVQGGTLLGKILKVRSTVDAFILDGGRAAFEALEVSNNGAAQSGGVVMINSGLMTVNGSLTSERPGDGSVAGINVRGMGVLQAGYSAVTDGTQLVSGLKPLHLGAGGTLNLTGYTGRELTVSEFGLLYSNLTSAGSTGTILGIPIKYNNESLQTVADAHVALPTTVVTGGHVTSGSAAVGGVTGATSVSGNAALTLTGQAPGSVLADAGVTLNNATLTLGHPVGNGGGTVHGGLMASEGTNTINVVNGAVSVAGGIAGNANTTINVGNGAKAAALMAENVRMGGGRVDFDPPFLTAGDTSNASMGGLSFASTGLDARINVGRNSMVSLGSTDAEWLRTEVKRYQQDGKGLWGQDVTAALALRTPQTLNASGSLRVDGAWVQGGVAPAVNTATFADKSLLVVDAAGVGSKVALAGSGSGALTVSAGARLHIVGGQHGEVINITDNFGASTKDAASWAGAALTTSTGLLTATGGVFNSATGSYSVRLAGNKAIQVFPLLSDSMATMIDSVFDQTPLNVNATDAGVRFLSRATSDQYLGRSNTSLAAATIEGAAQMATVGAVQGATLSARRAGENALVARMRFATPAADPKGASVSLSDGQPTASSGVSGGTDVKNGLGLWAMPLWQMDSVSGMKAENFSTGYTANLGGIAAGADYTVANAYRFGLALNVGGGYAKSRGDFNSTDNRFNFWGLSGYGGWSQNNFALTADVGYSSTANKVRQETPAAMNFGNLKADVDAHAISTGLRGEYRFELSALDITPHVGIRYTWLGTRGYDVKSGDGTVFRVDGENQSLWTFPVGVTFSKAFETDSGWTVRPLVDLGVIPAAGDVKAKSRVHMPGLNAAADLQTQVADRLTFDGALGFEVKKNNVALGLNYSIQASQHRTAHGVFANFRYAF